MDNENILEVKGISKSFPGVKALEKVSITIKKGSVHALMGENGAGKSTLMKCLFGLYKPDEGEIFLNGQKVAFNNSKEALDAGISMIQQELRPVYQRSIMENIWLGRYPTKAFFIDNRKMYNDTLQLLKSIGMDKTPNTLVKNLTASQIQLMEIAKAVSYKAKVIFMDEPTSSLTSKEVEHLFTIIRTLQQQGVAIVYVSHKMDEILQISSEVSIMRDGKLVGTYLANTLTTEKIIAKMVGREMTQLFPKRRPSLGEEMLKVDHFSSTQERSFQDISFNLKKGEILGIGGLMGSQRTELIEALFGLRQKKSGSITIKGKEVTIRNPQQAKKHKMVLLTEERRATGIFPILSVADNTTVASLANYQFGFLQFLKFTQMRKDVAQTIQSMQVKTPSTKTHIKNLSGGNQQKVLFGRWLLTNPDILILDEPTRGIDVGAKYEIYQLMNNLVAQGKSIIMISSEMAELIGMSDRIMVMSNGRLAGIEEAKTATEEKIMTLATKFLVQQIPHQGDETKHATSNR